MLNVLSNLSNSDSLFPSPSVSVDFMESWLSLQTPIKCVKTKVGLVLSHNHEEFSDIWERNPSGLSVMTQPLPGFFILKDIHGTLKWQSDNFEHLNSPWIPIFRAPHSTPILCHPCPFCFHMLNRFRYFSLFLRKTCEAARSNPAENIMWKEGKA